MGQTDQHPTTHIGGEVLSPDDRSDFINRILTPLSLVEAYRSGMKEKHVLSYFNVTETELHDFIGMVKQDDREYQQKLDGASNFEEAQAHAVKYRAIAHEHDLKTAIWYLERRNPDFNPKAEIKHSGKVASMRDMSDEELMAMAEDSVEEIAAVSDQSDE